MPEELLVYLNRIEVRNLAWRVYLEQRAVEVQQAIDRLHRFANLKPGRVADACNARAQALQERLNQILAKGGDKHV